MPGFSRVKNLIGSPAQGNETLTIANSVTMTLGGLARGVVASNPTANNGAVVEDSIAGETLLYLCEGFVTNAGVPLDNADAADFAGATRGGTSGLLGSETLQAASDNQTVRQVRAMCSLLTIFDVLVNDPDATPGTTAGAYTRGNYTDLITTAQVDENNNGNSFTVVAQLLIWGRNPDKTSTVFYIPKEIMVENG